MEHTLYIRCVFVDRGLSQSHINDAQSTHKKIKKQFESGKLVANAQACFHRKVRMNSSLLTCWTHTVRIKPYNANVDNNNYQENEKLLKTILKYFTNVIDLKDKISILCYYAIVICITFGHESSFVISSENVYYKYDACVYIQKCYRLIFIDDGKSMQTYASIK